MNRWWIVVAFLVGCGSKSAEKPDPKACAAACEHVLELGLADIDKSAAGVDDPELKKMTLRLKEKAMASRESDLATCQTQCMAGKMNTACAVAAATIDSAMECTNRNGGQR